MRFLLLLAIAAADDDKASISIDASSGKVTGITVNGNACAAPALYVAAATYLAELKPCASVSLKRVELKGDAVTVSTEKGVVACGLRPAEGRMRIQAGACASP